MSFAAEVQERSLDLELDYAFHRASGDATCAACKRAYRRHPLDNSKLRHDGRPFLRVLCDGQRVQL
jgi:hypothetical protein